MYRYQKVVSVCKLLKAPPPEYCAKIGTKIIAFESNSLDISSEKYARSSKKSRF
jgi:hypothetical protein